MDILVRTKLNLKIKEEGEPYLFLLTTVLDPLARITSEKNEKESRVGGRF